MIFRQLPSSRPFRQGQLARRSVEKTRHGLSTQKRKIHGETGLKDDCIVYCGLFLCADVSSNSIQDDSLSLSIYIYIYTHIHTHTYTHAHQQVYCMFSGRLLTMMGIFHQLPIDRRSLGPLYLEKSSWSSMALQSQCVAHHFSGRTSPTKIEAQIAPKQWIQWSFYVKIGLTKPGDFRRNGLRCSKWGQDLWDLWWLAGTRANARFSTQQNRGYNQQWTSIAMETYGTHNF